MTFKEIQELLKLVNKLNLTEFKMQEGDFKLSIRTKHYDKGNKMAAPIVAPAPQQVIPVPSVQQPFAPSPPAAPAPSPSASKNQSKPKSAEEETKNYLEIRSPIVGTFYRSSSPDKPPYVKVGDVIEAGAVVCIVEAMKLFNEIESEISGRIVKVSTEDAQPVEYDQVLFLVDPKG